MSNSLNPEMCRHRQCTPRDKCCVIPVSPPVYAFGTNSAGSIAVIPCGTDIPLDEHKKLSCVFVNDDSTVFTVLKEGVYRLVYHVNTEAPSTADTRLLRNGKPIEASVLSYAYPVNQYSAEVLVHLDEGDAISLQLFAAVRTIRLLYGAGASLSIQKVN